MKNILFISVAILLCGSHLLFAQQQFTLSQYYQTQSILNPAFSGVDDFWDVKIGYRQKWIGLENSPSTSFVSFTGSIGDKTSYNQSPLRTSNPNQVSLIESQKFKLKSHGIGGYITKQEQGAFDQINAMLNYAYHIPVNPKIKVSVGSTFGLSSVNVDLDKISVWDKLSDPIYQSYANGSGNYLRFLFGIGGVIYGKKSYVGISYLPIIDTQITGESQELNTAQKIIIMTGTKFDLGPYMKVLPSVLVETSGNTNTRYVGSLLFDIKSIVKTGLAYSSTNDLSFNLMFNYKNNYGLSYAFETSIGGEATIGNGTHEVILSFSLFNHLNLTPRLW